MAVSTPPQDSAAKVACCLGDARRAASVDIALPGSTRMGSVGGWPLAKFLIEQQGRIPLDWER
jgi:hypothetical protein